MDLASRAEAAGTILQVGHQERFVLEAMGLFDVPEVPISIDAVRAGPPAPDGRAGDVSVIWDLMIHDLDLVAKLLGEAASVTCQGRRVHTEHIDDAVTELEFAGAKARLRASRAAEARQRSMSLRYPSGTVAIDFLARSIENTTSFNVTADVSDIMPDPLGAADEAFFAACLGERECAIPGREAAMAVVLAERAENSAFQPAGG